MIVLPAPAAAVQPAGLLSDAARLYRGEAPFDGLTYAERAEQLAALGVDAPPLRFPWLLGQTDVQLIAAVELADDPADTLRLGERCSEFMAEATAEILRRVGGINADAILAA